MAGSPALVNTKPCLWGWRRVEPVGGAARFVGAIDQLRGERPLILFSGDALSPSLLSTLTRGEHMVRVLNAAGVHAACVGNHEFDFGLDVLEERVRASAFPWLLSNVTDRRTGQPPAGLQRSCLLRHGGLCIGLLGLVERGWMETTRGVDLRGDLVFEEPGAVARRLGPGLRRAGADLVVALTHMRAAADAALAAETGRPALDLVLGGHDHDWCERRCPETGLLILKSGTDFAEFSRVHRVAVTSATPENVAVRLLVDDLERFLGSHLDDPLGWAHVPLDARSDAMRSGETALGNLLADAMRLALGCEVAFFNGGTVRSDGVHPPGQLRVRDVRRMLPFSDELLALALTGAELVAALEVGLARWPAREGRFLQVSGLRAAFDPAQAPGQRVVPGSVRVNGAPLERGRTYAVATKSFLGDGKDGYGFLRRVPRVETELLAPSLGALMQLLLSQIEEVNAACAGLEIGAVDDAVAGSALAASPLRELAVLDPSIAKYGVAPRVEGRLTRV
ncbi:hypothetical protein QBZ16_004274 [Prototheca wickerhamii]|uniref:Bifunctional metallophosphatase/5'-nucleotidase n=1 Tax=Prototheca wickerhamii TaxID=3111 RepID=A0AAD9MGS1_PROWI|nr:hypothetical protein QBZ16_004274 [Prototheca wickerhamii]